jgi:hypothetical protein
VCGGGGGGGVDVDTKIEKESYSQAFVHSDFCLL